MDNIVVKLPAVTLDVVANPARMVDDIETCSLCYEYILPRREGSILCSLHGDRVEDLAAKESFTTG